MFNGYLLIQRFPIKKNWHFNVNSSFFLFLKGTVKDHDLKTVKLNNQNGNFEFDSWTKSICVLLQCPSYIFFFLLPLLQRLLSENDWPKLMCSTFEDIFDEAYFIESLKGDVQVVRGLPKELESVPRARKHFTSWSGAGYYEEMARLFKDYKVSNYCEFFLNLPQSIENNLSQQTRRLT